MSDVDVQLANQKMADTQSDLELDLPGKETHFVPSVVSHTAFAQSLLLLLLH